jgi:hypothetical protein
MRDEDDIPGTCVDVAPPRPRYSLGFNPMSWTVGAGVVVLVQFFVIAALVGAVLGLLRR